MAIKNGLAPFGTSPLLIEDPLVQARCAVPKDVRLVGDELHWKRDEQDASQMRGFVEGAPATNALWRFLDLWNAPAQDIANFAKEFGVLAIREDDGLPGTAPLAQGRRLPPVVHDSEGAPWFVEPIGAWRMYATGLRATLAFVVELQRNSAATPKSILREYDLDQFFRQGMNGWLAFGLPLGSDMGQGASVHFHNWVSFLSPMALVDNIERVGPKHARQWLGWHITSSWLNRANISPALTWGSRDFHLELRLGNSPVFPSNMLFGVVLAQLAAVLASGRLERIDRCSICGKLFEPAKKPGRHDRAFCPDHKLEGEQERKRRWARKQAAKKRAQEGG